MLSGRRAFGPGLGSNPSLPVTIMRTINQLIDGSTAEVGVAAQWAQVRKGQVWPDTACSAQLTTECHVELLYIFG